jgi:DNA-binding XRE family transcriptional regulator
MHDMITGYHEIFLSEREKACPQLHTCINLFHLFNKNCLKDQSFAIYPTRKPQCITKSILL